MRDDGTRPTRVTCAAASAATLAFTGIAAAQGGENWFDPTFIPQIPYCDTGTTVGYINDSDETCPYAGSTSPDVYYALVPDRNMTLVVSLIESGFDTKVYVYDDQLQLVPMEDGQVACNDDNCTSEGGGAWRSALSAVPVLAGRRYYIVIDGWSGAAGSYDLWIYEGVYPCLACGQIDSTCIVEPPEHATIRERDPCAVGDGSGNAGCDAPTPSFTTLACGDVVDGRAHNADGALDTDWYELISPGPYPASLRITLDSACRTILGRIDTQGAPLDCDAFPGFADVETNWSCDGAPTAIQTGPLPPGRHYIYVAADISETVTCELPVVPATHGPQYTLQVQCEPAPPPLLGEPPTQILDVPSRPLGLAVEGTTLAIGLRGNEGGIGPAGAVAIFERSASGRWTSTPAGMQTRLLTPPAHLRVNDDVGWFGAAVVLRGDVLAVGASGIGRSGTVFIYRRTSGGWTLVRAITPASDDVSYFGSILTLDAHHLVVRSSRSSTQGQVHIYRRDAAEGPDSWPLEQVLASGIPWDPGFGRALHLDHDVLLVGAPDYEFRGAAFVYRRDASASLGTGPWVLDTRLDAPPEYNLDYGSGVLHRNGHVLVANVRRNEAAVWTSMAHAYRPRGGDWEEATRLVAPLAEHPPCCSRPAVLAQTEDAILLGDTRDDDGRGGIHWFERTSLEWTATRRLVGPADTNGFGERFTTDGRTVLTMSDDDGVFVHDLHPRVSWDEILVHWGPCAGCSADFNRDGIVDTLDLLNILLP